MPSVSVIVPVYNAAKYLKKCLDSLVNQTLKDIEIIVVNDGSVDDSESILKKYAKKFKNLTFYNIENHGQAYARNYGLERACGEYIAFVDSDDYVDRRMFERILKKIDNSYDIVIFDYFIVDTKDNILETKKFSCKNQDNVTDIEYLFANPCPWNKLYKKSFLDSINFSMPVGIIYEDYCYIPTLVKYNPKIKYLNEEFYYYVQSDVSTVRGLEYKDKYADLIKATNILYDSFVGTKYMEEVCFIIYYHFLYLGSLNFYKYEKYDKIDYIADFMKNKFPEWRKNKYVRKRKRKELFLAYLFYNKKYNVIKFMQNIKKLVKYEK